MIIPCIDLMDGKAVQLVRGQTKALERADVLGQLEEFAGFPEVQVIDLDAAMGQGDNDPLVRQLCARACCRVGGGVRTTARAEQLLGAGASKLIIGTAAFDSSGVNAPVPGIAAECRRRCAHHPGAGLPPGPHRGAGLARVHRTGG